MDTDWGQIAALYGSLRQHLNSPIVDLNHSVAVSKATSPAEGIAILDTITELDDYMYFHVAMANLLKESGDVIGATAAFDRAREVSTSEAQRRFLTKELQDLGGRWSASVPPMTEQRIRREPPAFRRLSVRGTEAVSPLMTRVVLGGDELEGFAVDRPAASVRLLLPAEGTLEIPIWAGNEFLLSSGTRPIIRTFTPRRFDEEAMELSIDVVLHGSGAASRWAETTRPGDEVAVSGPGRGYDIDPNATAFLLVGDETAIPAICQLLEHLPSVPIQVHLMVTHPDAMVDLHRDTDLTWHVADDDQDKAETLGEAVRDMDLVPGLRIWAAGEAAAMQRIRNYLFREIDFPRTRATIRGYWKHDIR